MEYLYRVFSTGYHVEGRIQTRMERFPVLKKTPCGAWINTGSDYPGYEVSKKFVRLFQQDMPTFKRWACPSEEEAIVSYRRRKASQVKILRGQLLRAEAELKEASRPGFKPDEPIYLTPATFALS